MELGLSLIFGTFIVGTYVWTLLCLSLVETEKDKKGIVVFGKYVYTFILVFLWTIQLVNHHTIIYWRITELFK